MNRRRLLVSLAGLVAALTAACGGSEEGNPSTQGSGPKIVEVKMVDIAYEPKEISVAKGQEVRFVFVNDGKIRHEAFIGDADEQVEHEEAMKAGGDDGGGHDAHGGDTNPKVTVEPGKEADLTHKFEEAGTFEVGCHEPGHYDAGMKIEVVVS